MIDKDKRIERYSRSKINTAIRIKNLQIMLTHRRHYGNAMLRQLATKVPILK